MTLILTPGDIIAAASLVFLVVLFALIRLQNHFSRKDPHDPPPQG